MNTPQAPHTSPPSSDWKMRLYERIRRRLINHARHRMPDAHPRRWSNAALRGIAPLFKGQILNVSGWRDEDKQGACYRDYFINAATYAVTNFRGTARCDDNPNDSIFLDLEAPLPARLHATCDLAWTHTVLEHVGDIETAFCNLGGLTRDAVLVIVPWIQDEHYTPGLYGDYWRFTPLGLQRLMERAGLTLIHLSANEQPWYPVYLLAIGSKQPQQWDGRFPPIDWDRRLGCEQYNYPGSLW